MLSCGRVSKSKNSVFMSHLKSFALFLCFIYFLALIMGYPETHGPSTDPTSIKITEEEVKGEGREGLGLYWKTGFLKKIYLQNQALKLFEEELLEGDTKPKEIFRRLQRSLVQNIFFIGLCLFWLCLLGFYLLNSTEKYLFLNKLSTFLLLFSSILLLIDLFLLYHKRSVESILEIFFTSTLAVTQSIILFFGVIILFHQFMLDKIKSRKKEKRSKAKDREVEVQNLHFFSMKWKLLFPLVFHFFLICIAALLLANFFLFPLYSLQLSFPNFFALFLFMLVLLLIAYYTHAYWRMFFGYKVKNNFSIALTFLGYRLLRNTLFLLSIFIIVSLLVGSVIFITAYNVDILNSL